MADNGRLYAGFDADFPPVMAALCAEADYITPNITEACLLTGTEYRELHDGPYLRRLLDGLRALGAKNVILTGVRQDPAHMAVAVMDASGRFFLRTSEYVPGVFHGAGDLFASVCAGALTLGWTAGEAAGLAAEYVARTIRATVRDSEARWYGLSFESTLPTLAELLQHRRNFHAFTE